MYFSILGMIEKLYLFSLRLKSNMREYKQGDIMRYGLSFV